ncbi:hypothetical protein ACIGQE_25785 [Streptomyces sp. NPDC053429]|uniref:hypothetical protein n=1 Tax=Streptomyces sp. NPDC053429 TaxID=3365702 RepID=UPI0037D82C9C
MTESGQGSGHEAAPQAGAPWGGDAGYGAQEPGSGAQPSDAPGYGAQPEGARQPERPGAYGGQEPRTQGGPAYGYPAQAPPGYDPQSGYVPQPGYGYPPPGHVVGPGFEGPGDPHGYGYPPLPEAVTQYIPPIPGTPGPLEAATQYIPPVPGHHEAATQYIAPVPAHHEAATQYIPPVADGPAHHEAATQYIAPVPAHHEAATQYIPPVPAGPGHHEAATQYMPPVPAAPSDSAVQGFDGLFRSDGNGDGGNGGGAAGHTQQLPPVQEPVLPRAPRPRGPVGPPGQPVPPGQQFAPAPPPPPPAPPRKVSAGVIAAAVIGLAVAGLGVGSLLADGGKAGNSDPGAEAPAPTGSAAAAAGDAQVDPGRPQAVQLDKVLADSNESRAAVIKAVDDIKSCRNLDQAALDLRDAARKREEMVTRLQELKMDELPDHVKLAAALTKAWKSSAAADRGYASWADDVAHDKGGCKDGKAKSTDHAADGNKSSGEATRAKESAATMWNSIAAKYGLTRRDKTEL